MNIIDSRSCMHRKKNTCWLWDMKAKLTTVQIKLQKEHNNDQKASESNGKENNNFKTRLAVSRPRL